MPASELGGAQFRPAPTRALCCRCAQLSCFPAPLPLPAAQVFSRGAKFSLFKPAEEMVYIGLDDESRTKGKGEQLL